MLSLYSEAVSGLLDRSNDRRRPRPWPAFEEISSSCENAQVNLITIECNSNNNKYTEIKRGPWVAHMAGLPGQGQLAALRVADSAFFLAFLLSSLTSTKEVRQEYVTCPITCRARYEF